MIYAPIIIPTLNRYDHLKRMMDSILNNYQEMVKNTDLYISVDYPPSSTYEEGYKKVCSYIDRNKEYWSGCFKSFYVYFQEINIGPFANADFLYSAIEENGNDRFIFAEDDNYFAPNVLEFLNYELDRFCDDDNIYAVCSNGVLDGQKYESQIVKTVNFSAQVYGGWIRKIRYYEEKTTIDYLYKNFVTPKFLLRIIKENAGAFFEFAGILKGKKDKFIKRNGEVVLIDQIVKIHLMHDSRYVVCSSRIKAVNFGYDGSGVNCPKMEDVSLDALDLSDRYECKDELLLPIDWSYNKINLKLLPFLAYDFFVVLLLAKKRDINSKFLS